MRSALSLCALALVGCGVSPINSECGPVNTTLQCGSCTNNCMAGLGANVEATCESGQCVYACRGSFQNCSSDPTSRGCGSNPRTDVEHCGSCGVSCVPTVAASGARAWGCDAGVCTRTCSDSRLNCDGDHRNGCEQPIDALHCGRTCDAPPCVAPSATNHVATSSCNPSSDGGLACVVTCVAPFADCDRDPSNGCEADTSTELSNCGRCGGCYTGQADSCVNGECRCGTGRGCSSGDHCSGGFCRCDPTSCGGCCGSGGCQSGISMQDCGNGGRFCNGCYISGGNLCTSCTDSKTNCRAVDGGFKITTGGQCLR